MQLYTRILLLGIRKTYIIVDPFWQNTNKLYLDLSWYYIKLLNIGVLEKVTRIVQNSQCT